MDNRLDRHEFDAALHLLDRQVVDREALHVCKVDDLELSFGASGPPAVTRILAGPAALVPRLSRRSGHWLRARWLSLGVQYADRDVPLAVPLEVVRCLGAAVELSVHREGLLDRQPPPPPGVRRRRLGELLGADVVTDHADLRGKVLDVRLDPRTEGWTVRQLLVGPGRPGSLLGYDRGDFTGPWMVRTVVRRLHRHLRLVDWDAVEGVDWDRRQVRISSSARVRHPGG